MDLKNLRIRLQFASAFCLLLVSAKHACSEHWPQFRGPNSDGIATSNFPDDWDVEKNVRWKIPTEGEGWSCPVVWEDQVFFTSAVPTSAAPADEQPYREGRRRNADLSKLNYRWDVVCVDAKTGKLRWRQTANQGNPRLARHHDNSYATETPVTDGKRVYAYFGMTGLYCYDMKGELIWKKDLGNYEMRAGWGTASSPVLFADKLYLQIDNEQQSFIVALSAETGDEIWRVERDEPSQYSSPVLWQNSKRNEIVAGGQVSRGYDPESGKLLWELEMEKGRSSASPVTSKDRLFVGTELRNRGGSDDGGGYLMALRPTDSGIEVEWKLAKSGIQMASPVLASGHLYLFERRSGTLYCVDAETGKRVYRKRVPGARAFWASPWTHANKVFCLDDGGTTHVLAGGPNFEVLDTNVLDERTWSSPAIAGGALYLRTAAHLYCIASGGN